LLNANQLFTYYVVQTPLAGGTLTKNKHLEQSVPAYASTADALWELLRDSFVDVLVENSDEFCVISLDRGVYCERK